MVRRPPPRRRAPRRPTSWQQVVTAEPRTRSRVRHGGMARRAPDFVQQHTRSTRRTSTSRGSGRSQNVDEIVNDFVSQQRTAAGKEAARELFGQAKSEDGGRFGFMDVPKALGTGVMGALKGLDAFRSTAAGVLSQHPAAKAIRGELDWTDIVGTAVGAGLVNLSNVPEIGTQAWETWRDSTSTLDAIIGEDLAQDFREANPWLATVAGIATDVITDPLVYAGVGAGKSAATLARQATTNPKLVKALGGIENARKTEKKLQRYGSDAYLSSAEKAAYASVGETTGLAVRMPGKGIIGRTAARGAASATGKSGRDVARQMKQTRRKTLAGHDTFVGRQVDRARRGARHPIHAATGGRVQPGGARAWMANKGLNPEQLQGSHPTLRAAIRGINDATGAFQTHLDLVGEARSGAERLRQQTKGLGDDLMKRAKKAGVSPRDLWYAMTGDAQGMRNSGVFGREAQQLGRDAPEMAEALAGTPFMPRAEEAYGPRRVSKAWEEHMEVQRNLDGREVIMDRRKYGVGDGQVDEFEGVRLLPPDQANGRSIERQINEIARERGIAGKTAMGEEGVSFYVEDFEEAWDWYTRLLARQSEKEYVANGLKLRGLATGTETHHVLRDVALRQQRWQGLLKGATGGENRSYWERNRQKLLGLMRRHALEGGAIPDAPPDLRVPHLQGWVEEELTVRRAGEMWRREADEMFERAARSGSREDLNVALMADADSKYAVEMADRLDKWATERGAMSWEQARKGLSTKDAEQALTSAVEEMALRQIGSQAMAPEQIADMLNAVSKFQKPGWANDVLRGFDKVQNLFKQYSVLTPGFHWRNNLGSFIQNWMGDVDIDRAYTYVGRLRKARRAKTPQDMEKALARAKVPDRVKDAFREANKLGVGKTGQTRMEVLTGMSLFPQGGRFEQVPFLGALARPSKFNPFSTEFAPARVSREKIGDSVEAWHREAAFIDTYLKTGGDVSESFARTMKLHFDYADVSALEREVGRRLFPFYLWNRRNLSLQFEFIASQPARMNRYFRIKANIEALSQEEDRPVPQYFFNRQGIRMPENFKLPLGSILPGGQIEGRRAYAFPDIPTTTLFDLNDPDQFFSHLSPAIKTPWEFAESRRMYKDIPLTDEYKPMPRALEAVPGLVPVLEKLPLGPWSIERHAETGKPMMRERYAYTLEQLLPTLGQVRRLAPDPEDEAYGERQLQSFLSWAFGINFRVNIDWESRSEVYRRWGQYQERIREYDSLGFDPAEAEQKAIMDVM